MLLFRKIWFCPSFFLLFHSVTSLGGDGETTVDYIKQWIENARFSTYAHVDNLDAANLRIVIRLANNAHIGLKKKYDDERRRLEKTYDDEGRNRLVFQSFIDISPSAENLFVYCWPLWAGKRPENKRLAEHWQMLLLNVENPIIFQLRKTLLDSGIAVETFINEMMLLELKRHERAHLDIKETERDEAQAAMKKHLGDDAKMKIFVAFQAALDTLYKMENIVPDSNDRVFSVISKERLNYTLLRMPNFPHDADEKRTKELFEGYTLSPNENIPKPIAVWITRFKGAYFLFKSFKEAYTVWSDKGVFYQFTEFHIESMVVNAWKYYEFQSFAVKIDLTSAKCNIENYKKKVGWGDATTMTRLQNEKKKEDILYVFYYKIDLALLHYEKCKEELGYGNVEFLSKAPILKGTTLMEKIDFDRIGVLDS